MPITEKYDAPLFGHMLGAGFYARETRLIDTLEDCEAAFMPAYRYHRCSRKARYAVTGVVLYNLLGPGSTVEDSPTETRYLCTQHERKTRGGGYINVIVRAQR
jgi:hypothetical protein